MLLAEHSPVRLVNYIWEWGNIPQWVTVHFVRHHVGCEKFIASQRPDINLDIIPSRDISQNTPNTMCMTANAQSIINISKKRLCTRASKATREAWKLLLDELDKIDPVLTSACVPECVYRGFCPEWKSCKYDTTDKFKKHVEHYQNLETYGLFNNK